MKKIDFFEVISIIYLFLVIIIITLTAVVGNHTLFLVLMGFFPTILVIIISLLLYKQYQEKQKLLLLLPILIVALFYIIGKGSTAIQNTFDVNILTGVNFILALIYVLVVYIAFGNNTPKQQIKQQVQKIKRTYQEPKMELKDYIHSIEDKSKALNFVIGRVYNKYHGGTNEMRELLRIPAEWYNEFSLIGVGTDSIDYAKLNEIITKFELQLGNFEKTESELFKTKITHFKNLIRETDGSELIIDVLDHNDKDPVRSYYEGAVEFCKKVRTEMNDNKLNLVKNEYIPKNDEEEAELRGVPTSENFKKKEHKKEQEEKKIIQTKKETDTQTKKKNNNQTKEENNNQKQDSTTDMDTKKNDKPKLP